MGINNSNDDTKLILNKIATVYPNVHILDVNDTQASFMQAGCYRVLFDYARKQSTSNYCLFVDVDEFWVADPFPRQICDYISDFPAFDVFSFHWILIAGENLFSAPLSLPREYIWDSHVKSICSYDAEILDLRCHAPLIPQSNGLLLMRGNCANTEITTMSYCIDIHEKANDFKSSPIGKRGLAWVFHRLNRSEIEYSYRLFKRHANANNSTLFKTNRYGYNYTSSTEGAHEYFATAIPKDEIIKYHDSLNSFLLNCNIWQEVEIARKQISEDEIYHRLRSIPEDIIAREKSLLLRIFSGTRFIDFIKQVQVK